MAYPSITADQIGWLDEQQMVEVDRVMIEDLHIELIQMMENAGRNLAALVVDRFAPATVSVLVGSGGNGGGGLVAARHLANRGVDVSVTLGKDPARLGPIPAHQLDVVRRMAISNDIAIVAEPRPSDVVVDALIGYSLRGEPRGRVAELIESAAAVDAAIVALDTPSGLDVSNGTAPGAVIEAAATLTLALPKLGLRAAPEVGELYVADISVPPSVYSSMGVGPAPPFGVGPIVRVET